MALVLALGWKGRWEGTLIRTWRQKGLAKPQVAILQGELRTKSPPLNLLLSIPSFFTAFLSAHLCQNPTGNHRAKKLPAAVLGGLPRRAQGDQVWNVAWESK